MAKQISIVVEYIVGNVRETIQHMIKMYNPSMLVVGTRGRNQVKGFFMGSISHYCLHHASIPVIVVRPERKINQSKTKAKAKGIFKKRSASFTDESRREGMAATPDPLSPSLLPLSSSTSSLSSIATGQGGGGLVLPQRRNGIRSSTSVSDLRSKSSGSLLGLGLFSTAVGESRRRKNSLLDNMKFSASPPPPPHPLLSVPGLCFSPEQKTIASPLSQSPPLTVSSPTSSIISLSASSHSGQSSINGTRSPECVGNMKKSLTIDGGSTSSLSSLLSGRGFSKSMLLGSLNLGGNKKEKKEEKDGGGGGSSSSSNTFLQPIIVKPTRRASGG
ncbi:hypothetical protein BGZ94_003486 [Podila epigama]|nr:hypothetical protein BGZ94_003486 [Podila epigama]